MMETLVPVVPLRKVLWKYGMARMAVMREPSRIQPWPTHETGFKRLTVIPVRAGAAESDEDGDCKRISLAFG